MPQLFLTQPKTVYYPFGDYILQYSRWNPSSECSIRNQTNCIWKSNNYILPKSASIPIFFLGEWNLNIYQFPYPKILDSPYPSLLFSSRLINWKVLSVTCCNFSNVLPASFASSLCHRLLVHMTPSQALPFSVQNGFSNTVAWWDYFGVLAFTVTWWNVFKPLFSK